MKPAPATSVRASSGLSGNAATMAAASSRGFRRAAFARRSATLVAKSPCCASRVRSMTTAEAAGISGSTPPASRSRADSSSCSSSCFKVRSSVASRRASLAEPKAAAPSEKLERINIERPAHRACTSQLLDLRQPLIEKGVQWPPLAALDQQLRVIAPGALRQRRAREPVVARGEQMLEQRMIREFRLDQHLAGATAAPGASRDLHDGLCEALRGAEVGAEQTLVRVQHHHESYVRKIVTLGHHLRADEDTRLARGHASHHSLSIATPA